jgi:hypothetical protein
MNNKANRTSFKGGHAQSNTGKTHFKKGYTPWNKGKKCPEISLAKIGKKRPDMLGNKYWIGGIHPNTGKQLTKEQKSKLNLSGLKIAVPISPCLLK